MTQQKSISTRERQTNSDVVKLLKAGHSPVKKLLKEFGELKDKRNNKKKDEIFLHPGSGAALGSASFAMADVDGDFTRALLNPVTNDSGNPEENGGTALGRLMAFYESEETADEEENEIDLMSQLNDMTSNNANSDD